MLRPNLLFRILVSLFLLVAGLTPGFSDSARSESPSLETDWACVMSGQTTQIRFPLDAESNNNAYRWTLKKQQRTLAVGRVTILNEPDTNQTIGTVQFDPPKVVNGRALRLTLELNASETDDRRRITRRLIILPSDPFSEPFDADQDSLISLFDPSGKTRAVLKDAGVRTSFVRDLAAIDLIDKGVLIIGEATNLDRYAGLSTSLAESMRRGVDIICLAPSSGTVTLPMPVNHVTMKGHQAIRDVQRFFDDRSWHGVDPIQTKFAIETLDDSVEIKSGSAKAVAGWPWVELRQKSGNQKTTAAIGGTITMVGFGIIQHWDRGPVPRHLLHRIIESKR